MLTRGLLEREVRNKHSPRAGLDVEFDSEPLSSCGISRGRGEKEKETNMKSVVSTIIMEGILTWQPYDDKHYYFHLQDQEVREAALCFIDVFMHTCAH